MYPGRFDYHRADTVSEALDLLEDHAGREVELLSGGHSLLPTMKTGLASPEVLIDIGDIADMTGVEPDGDRTIIGANTRYADIAASDLAWERCTQLAEAAHAVGDIQVRNRGTIGGNIAHSDPAADLPAAVLASNAAVVVRGPDGERSVDADDFFEGMYMTALAEDEILTRVEVPNLGENDAGAYAKKPSPSSGFAMVGVAVRLRTDGDEVESARVAANGAFDHATRLEATEGALEEASVDDGSIAEEAASLALDGVDEFMLMDDIQASGEFRGQLVKVYAERAIETALERAGG